LFALVAGWLNMIWLPGNGSKRRSGDHPMPSLAATTSSHDPYPIYTEIVRLAEDGAMFKIAQFEKQFRYAWGATAKSSNRLQVGRN
jgi:hypothetical protein